MNPGRSEVADFLQLDPGQAPAQGVAAHLTEQIRRAIDDGRLRSGDRLPPSRVLAQELGLSRGVVTEVYRRLAEDGRVSGHGRGGTVVSAVDAVQAPVLPAVPDLPDPFTGPAGIGTIDALRRAAARIDLAPGLPDLAAFPRTAWMRAERRVLDVLDPADFGYPDPRGLPVLRERIAAWLARHRGIVVPADRIQVVAGVAQALWLTAAALRHRGVDSIAVEDPGSLGAREQLRRSGLAVPPVPVDDDGLDVGALLDTAAPAVLVTPAHQFPTGVVLSGDRRRELLRWAADGGWVVEDDYDAEHRYDRPPVPALWGSAPERVFHCGSVSKLLAPGIRIGWLLPPLDFAEEIFETKRQIDLGNPVIAQLVLAELMRSGELERHLRWVRARHRTRRDLMAAGLAAGLPEAVVHGAAAGLHLTVTLPQPLPAGWDVTVAEAALAAGVKVHPLSWHRQFPGPAGFVLGYAAAPPDHIEAGTALLVAAIRDRLPR